MCSNGKFISTGGEAPTIDHLGQHHQCTLVDCFFGKTRSCTLKYILQLQAFISNFQHYIPTVSLHILSTAANTEAIIAGASNLLPSKRDAECFASSQLLIKRLRGILHMFLLLPDIENPVSLCLDQHDNLPSRQKIAMTFRNLHRIQHYILTMKSEMENTLFHVLDIYPKKTADNLRSVMKLVCIPWILIWFLFIFDLM